MVTVRRVARERRKTRAASEFDTNPMDKLSEGIDAGWTPREFAEMKYWHIIRTFDK